MNRRSHWILRTLALAVLGLSLTACVAYPGGRHYGGGYGGYGGGYRSYSMASAGPAYGGWGRGGGYGGGWGGGHHHGGGYRGWR